MAAVVVAVIPLTRAQRRALLCVHVITSVGWLGASAVMLVLSTAGWAARSTETVRAAYWAEHLIGPLLLLPLSLLSLLTGVVLGLGSPWGLVRHVWVLAKLVLTTVAVLLTLFVLLPQIDVAYAHTRGAATGLGRVPRNLREAGIVSTVLYSFITVVSVLKPWGLTRWGRARRSRALAATRG